MHANRLRLLLTALAALLFLHNASLPQRPPARRGIVRENFFEMQRRYNRLFEARRRGQKEPPRAREADDEEMKFRRFELFWESRVDAQGWFATYFEHLAELSSDLGCDTCRGACHRSYWTSLGPHSLPTQNMGAVLSLWVNPSNRHEILAGTFSAGLYRTKNHGVSWERLTNLGCRGDCSGFPQGGVSSIAVDPTNTDVIYIALGVNRALTTEGYSLGVYKTTNGGVTWCPTGLKFDPTDYVFGTSKVVMDPSSPNTLYATAGHRVYKTTDAGATWKALYTSPNQLEITDLAVSRNPGSAGLYFAEAGERCRDGLNGCPPKGDWGCPIADGKIWYDPSFGNNSSQIKDITSEAFNFYASPTFEVRLDKALFSVTPNSVSILALSGQYGSNCPLGPNADRIIARNTNQPPALVASWTQHVNPQWAADSHGAGYPSAFAVSPVNDQLVLIGSDHGKSTLDDLFISNAGGAEPSPTPLNKDCLHADLRALAFVGSTFQGDETWIVGNDGGVAEATVSATKPTGKCKNLNGHGLTVTDFFGIGDSELDPSKIYGGAQDNGFFNLTNGAWEVDMLGDAYDVVVDATNPSKAYGTFNGFFAYTTDGGVNWTWPLPFTFTLEPRRLNTPMLIDGANTFYLGQRNVWRVHAGSPAATQLSNWSDPNDPASLRALHVAALNPSTIIVAKENATGNDPQPKPKVLRTDAAHYGAGAPVPWADITHNLPVKWQVVTGVTSDERGENVWASMGNYGPHVLMLRKGSKTWEDYSQGLPNLPVNVIRYWEGSGDDGLFVGTDVGVYYRNRNLGEWKRISCELPNVLVSDLEINNRTQKLRAATRGMGVWETSLAALKNQGCTGDAYLAASYTAGSGATKKELQNKAVVTDAVPTFPVTLTPRRVCCVEPCEAVSNYSWKVTRLWVYTSASQVVAAGQNSPVVFTPDYGFQWTRGFYKVEVSGGCGGKACPTLTVEFKQ